MKTRVLTIIIALLSMVAGAQAANYTALIYDGKTLTNNDIGTILALYLEGKIQKPNSDYPVVVKTTSGTTLFSYNNSLVCTVTGLTPWNNDMKVTFSSSTKTTLRTTAPTLAGYDGVDLIFDVAVNSNNFPNATFRTWVNSNIAGSDNLLTSIEVTRTIEIDVSGKGISNLKGIEYFNNLVTLDCGTNQLSSLDLSKNTNLVKLDCNGNKLTSLNLSKNTNLKRLLCYSNNISGSNMDNLISSLPTTSDGQFVVRSTSSSTGVDNEMTSAQVAVATQKGWRPITPIGLYYGKDHVAIIDASNFPDAVFRTWVSNNCDVIVKDGRLNTAEVEKIKSIIIAGTNITNPQGVGYFTSVTTLSLDNNKLTSLDASKNTALTNLSCCNNQLTSLKVSTSASRLTSISCYGNRLSGSSMDAFISSLPKVSNGTLKVRDMSLSTDNSMTYAQIVAAKKKGWTPMIKIGNNMQEYDGSDAIMISSGNFPDTNFRSWVSSNCDVNHNTYLSPAEIAAVTSINVNDQSISDLKGIEYFTALTKLECNSNQLTSLDVSKNTALTKLECNSNQLTSLDVSKNTALTWLECYNNQLTSLDVSKNTALLSLTCSNNKLSALNISKNTALTGLSCSENDLTSLDVSKNTELKSLDCRNNKLTALNLSNNTNLQSLDCRNNLLTSLDVSILKDNTVVNLLFCSGNNIRGEGMETLVKSLPKMSNGLFIVYDSEGTEGNQITTVQVAAAKAKGWKVQAVGGSDYPGYDAIAIDASNFPDPNFRNWLLEQSYGEDGYLSPAEIAAVTSINVNNKSISDLKGIEYFTALTELNCGNNQLTSLDLSGCKALTELNCGNNQLTSLDLSGCKALNNVYFHNNNIRGTNMTEFVNKLPIAASGSGELLVYNANVADGNEMTIAQVAAAKQKKWKVYMFANNTFDDYPGINVPGDANGDGEVNAQDIATVRDYILGLAPKPFSLESADLNGDSSVDIADLAKLIEKLKE